MTREQAVKFLLEQKKRAKKKAAKERKNDGT